MHRKQFLSLLGGSVASASLLTCLGGCSKGAVSANTAAPTNVDFTLDLTQPVNAALQTNGGYLYSHGVIIAKTIYGDYIAVQQICTHEQFTIVYQGTGHRFYCDGHGATFSETGAVTHGPASRALKQYNTSLNGNTLRISSS